MVLKTLRLTCVLLVCYSILVKGETVLPSDGDTGPPPARSHSIKYRVLTGSLGPVKSLSFALSGRGIVSGGVDKTTRVWNALTGNRIFEFPGYERCALAVSPGGNILAIVDENGLNLWDLRTGKLIQTLLRSKLPFTHFTFSLDGETIFATFRGIKFFVFDIKTGRESRRFGDPLEVDNWDSYCAFSRRRDIAARVSNGLHEVASAPCYTLYDLDKGKRIRHFKGNSTVPIESLVFSADGKSLVSGGRDGMIHFWDWMSGREAHQLLAHEEPVTFLTFSPDGRTLASSSSDGTICLWEMATKQLRARFSGDKGPVNCLAFSPDGRFLASGSGEMNVFVWAIADSFIRRAEPSASANRLEACWNDLVATDSQKAYTALWTLVSMPARTLPFMRDHLNPVLAIDKKRISSLINGLDDREFKKREEATQELKRLGDLAEIELSHAIKGTSSIELKRRADFLLKAIRENHDPQRTRATRAIEVLEYIGSPDAFDILEKLARGAGQSRITIEAKESIGRLKEKSRNERNGGIKK